ncbi:MAG: DJ-1/PfpI family protein [Promethearchaeota archaeon]
MKQRFVIVIALLVISLTFSSPPGVVTQDSPDVSDVKVLILLTDFFGWNYFDAKDRLEAWGVNVTTAAHSLDYDIVSCLNREPRPITADLLMSEMTPEMVSEFDCLLLTSGGHWQSMINSVAVMNFVSDAFDMGLTIASICTGTRMVAEANDIVNGSKVVSYTLSSPQMLEAGATPVWGMEAVADGQIITGGRGGGPTGGGYLEAPTSEVCAEIVREALGLSRVTDSTLSPERGMAGTNFSITASINNLNDTLGVILSTGITKVTAQIYGHGNRTLIDSIELVDNDHDGNYTGHFIAQTNGDYAIDIEVEDTNESLEVQKELEVFTIGPIPTEPIDVLVVSAIAGGGIIIIVLVTALVRKK